MTLEERFAVGFSPPFQSVRRSGTRVSFWLNNCCVFARRKRAANQGK